MTMIVYFMISLLLVMNAFCDEKINPNEDPDYRGEAFPEKYLLPENLNPTSKDFNHYMTVLNRTITYFAYFPNVTDVNKALGIFYMKSVLKRTLQENKNKLHKNYIECMKQMIEKADFVLSHYIYRAKQLDASDYKYRVSYIFRNDAPVVYSIKPFNKNILRHWILNSGPINEFVEEIDDATLPKEKYIEFVDAVEEYYIKIVDSDTCISQVMFNPEPTHLAEVRPCRPNPFCKKRTHTSPSISYTLSHRLLNILILRQTKRCYIVSEEKDDMHMDILCAFMYRETVYLARKGYFVRDMFLEHIALCGMLSYKEFFRRHWFYKITSWVDEYGCMQENRNFALNRTRLILQQIHDPEEQKKIRQFTMEEMKSICYNHQMALLVIVLAHALRYAAEFIPCLVV